MKNYYLKFKSPISVAIIIIVLCGIYSLNKIQTGLFPDITFPKIKIIADIGEQPVDKMMVTVTTPLENAIKRVEGLNLLRSTTSRGSCEISAFLDWKSDVDLGKQRVEAQINAIKESLPPGIKITVEKMNPSILPVMGFSLVGKDKNQIELRKIAEYTVKPVLSRIQGISEIAVIGGKIKEYQLIMDPLKMSNLRITTEAVANILSQTNFISSSGYTVDYNRLYLTLTDATIQNKNMLEELVIINTPKQKIKLKDICKIEIGERRDYIKINANGENVPLIAVLKQPNANLIQVADAVKKQLTEIKRVLPPGVELKPYYNQEDFVTGAIKSLMDVLWIGLLLAIIVAILFLRSLKASSVILITIPVTLGLSILSLYLIGYTLNIMTIGAIAAAIGIIIDDAIIVVEQIHRTHEENPDEPSSMLVNKAIKYLLPAMIGSSLSTIVIFLPFILMGGVAGAYFRVMTNTMIITLVSSFFVTWICLPVLYLLLFNEKHNIRQNSKTVKQRTWVSYFIRRPWISILFSITLVVLISIILPKLQSGFLPEMDEGSIVLDFDSPPGTSLEETDRMLKIVDNILGRIPEVETFSRRTGTQMGFFITEPNRGDYLIQLKNSREKTTEMVSDDIRKKIETALPQLRIDFGQVIGDMLGDLMASVQPIEIKIFGDNREKLSEIARSVTEIVEKTPGTTDVFNGTTMAGPDIRLVPDISALAQYQLTPADLQFQMETKIGGFIVGSILEKNQMVDIRMFEGEPKNLVNDYKKGSIFLKDGKVKPVSEFGNLIVDKGVAEIERENLKEMIAVTARLNNRDLGSTLKDIESHINNELHVPVGYEIVFGGAYAEQQQAFRELLSILIMAVLLVFTVILFLFRNIKVSLAIIFIAVLGIAGSLIALFIMGTPLNVGSYTGIIMIVGIIGENSIFTYLQYIKARKTDNDKDDAIVYSISTRLRPKLMTAIGAIAALFPLALGMGTGAQMHQPLAIAIIGGLIVALPLLLIVLPTLLRMIEK